MLWYRISKYLNGGIMHIHNINLNAKHFEEIKTAINENLNKIKKLGDTILELEDGTRVLLIFQSNMILCQYLDSLL